MFKQAQQNHSRFDYSNKEKEEEKLENSNQNHTENNAKRSYFPRQPQGNFNEKWIPTTKVINLGSWKGFINEDFLGDSEDTVTYEHYTNSAKKPLSGRQSMTQKPSEKQPNENLQNEMYSFIKNMNVFLDKMAKKQESPILVKEDCKAQGSLEHSLKQLNLRLSQL